MAGGRSLGPKGFLTEEEKKNRPKVTKKLILRILGYLKPYKWHFLLVFIALIISAVLGLFPSVITGKIVDAIVDRVKSKGKDMLMITYCAAKEKANKIKESIG